MIVAVYSLLGWYRPGKGMARLTMNRLLQHRAIVLLILCQAVVASFVTVPVGAEQPEVAQQQYERGATLLKKGDLAAASDRKSVV